MGPEQPGAKQAWESSWLPDNNGNAGLKTKAAQSQGASTDDRLYAFEAAGQLLGQEDLAVDEQEAAVRSLLQPLQQQMDEQLASAGKTPQGTSRSLCCDLPQRPSIQHVLLKNGACAWYSCCWRRIGDPLVCACGR